MLWFRGRSWSRNETNSKCFQNKLDGGRFVCLICYDDGLVAFVESNPLQKYFEASIGGSSPSGVSNYVKYLNGSLTLFTHSDETTELILISIAPASSAQYMKLESNGHLKVYEWTSRGWREVDDLLTGFRGECNYPTACGRYGICTMGQCSCPTSSISSTYFRPIDVRRPNLGYSEVTKLT